jgi:hypothetical protein
MDWAAVLDALANNPHISARKTEIYSGTSETRVHRILTRRKFDPYHVSLHQELHGNSFQIVYNFVHGHNNNS